jgi:hypothetical protein
VIFRITSMTRPVTAAQSRTQMERTNSAPRHDERATCKTSQNRTFCAYCTVHPTRPQDAQSRRDLGSMEDESLPTSGYGRSGATPSSDSAATPGAAGLGPGLGSVLGSFIHVRGRSPVVTRIVFARLADGGGRR